jgi:hypothetical protein
MVNFQTGRSSKLCLPELRSYCGPLTADLVQSFATDTGNHCSMVLPQLISVALFIFRAAARVRVASKEGLKEWTANILLWTCTVTWPGLGTLA